MKEPNVVRNQRDTVFRMLFKEKKELLTLYNAVAGKSYTDENELSIKTLENAVFLTYKNDLAFLIRTDLYLYEQQSTVNPNMPLRFLQYISEILEKEYITEKVYSKKRIRIPAPSFVIFYNGDDEQPERKIMRLSDSFEGIEKSGAEKTGDTETQDASEGRCKTAQEEKTEKTADEGKEYKRNAIHLELVAVQLNINPGYNEELKKNCPTLMGYVQYWEKIRTKIKAGKKMDEAVTEAVDECIKEGILPLFFKRNKAEVMKMSIYEFDQKEYEKAIRQDGYEEGIERGIERGIEQGIERGIEQGIEQGETNINRLYGWLFAQNRTEDVKRATHDTEYQKNLFAEMAAQSAR
ncbi:MAG: hypothetical protein K5739_05585 [Lachnospiraceae bacterium]|nr:hypothetical protein [Lachnospiraceae bacterium]